MERGKTGRLSWEAWLTSTPQLMTLVKCSAHLCSFDETKVERDPSKTVRVDEEGLEK